jgi:PAS domain S-box-containing protein
VKKTPLTPSHALDILPHDRVQPRLAAKVPSSPDVWEMIGTSGTPRTITAQSESEMSIAEMAAVLHTGFANAPVGLGLFRLDRTPFHVNPALCALLGYPEPELLASNFADLIHPDDVGRSIADIDRVVAGEGDAYAFDQRYIRKDGQVIWVHVSGSLVRDDEGTPRYFASQMVDITDHREEEIDRAATHQRTRQVLERITDGFYALDCEWCFTYVNEAAERMLDRTRQELLGRNIWDAFPEAVESPIYVSYQQAMAEGITTTVEFFFPPLDSWFETRAHPSPDGLSVFFRDVTASRRLVDELRESQEGLQTIVDHVPAVIYILEADEAQTARYFSPRLEALTGYRPDEALTRPAGWHWLETVHPEDRDRVAEEDARTVAAGEPLRIEYRYLRKDGSYVWVLDECVPVRDDSGKIIAWHGVLLDISARVQAEEERSHLASIVESAEDGILSCTLDGVITSWNHGAEKLYGYRIDEALGQSVLMLRPPGLTDDLADLMEGVRHGKSIEGHETERLTKDGRRVCVSLSISPLRDANGSITGIASISRDITALREAEAALRLRDRALAAATNGMLITDATRPGNPIVDVNPAFERLTGYQRSEVLGRNCRFLQGADTDPDAVKRLREAISAGRDVTETLLNYRKDGAPFWNELHIAAVRDDAGHLTHYVGIQTDVSERIAADAALRESEARFRGVWENTRDAMSLTDENGTILAINPAHRELYGFAPESIVGKPFSIIFPERARDERQADHRAIFAQDVPRMGFESTVPQPDGTVREVEGRTGFIEIDGERTMMVSAMRDVTDRKRLEHDLRQALDAAEAAAHSKSLFLAMMSHELRTPLQAVLGYSDWLLLEPESSLTPEQQADLGNIRNGAIRMMGLVDELLDLSRMEVGQLALAEEPVDLAVTLEQVRQDVAPQAAAKNLDLSIDIPPGLPPVSGDPSRLRQILLNLAANAVKFTDVGTIRITASVADEDVQIKVSDTGIGINADDLPVIFEEFHQVDGSMSRRHGGAGLGLAIAQRLAKQMGGAITVASTVAVGSTFTLRMPAAVPPHPKTNAAPRRV